MKNEIILLTLVTVLMSGCDFFEFYESFGEDNKPLGLLEEKACDAMDPSTVDKSLSRDHCYQGAALKQSKPSLCAKIKSPGPKTKCYMLLAEKLSQLNLCNQLEMYPEAYSGAYSRIECWYKVAIKTKNPSTCNQIGTHKLNSFTVEIDIDTCHMKVAGCGEYLEPCCPPELTTTSIQCIGKYVPKISEYNGKCYCRYP